MKSLTKQQTPQPRSPSKKSPAKKSTGPALAAIFRGLDKMYPDPHCELYYESPYQLLVSVILSAQTTDKMVNRCMEPHYRAGLTLDTVLDLGVIGFLAIIRSIGLAPTKSKHILAMSQILKDRFHGEVPGSRELLEQLPGVGRKTANVILGEIFAQPTLAVDTHVFRVSQRLGLHQAKTPLAAELALLALIPAERLPKAHHQMIHLGRYVCKARRPECERCALAPHCPTAKTLR